MILEKTFHWTDDRNKLFEINVKRIYITKQYSKTCNYEDTTPVTHFVMKIWLYFIRLLTYKIQMYIDIAYLWRC